MTRLLTSQEFIDKANIKYNSFFDYSLVNYINGRTKIKIICPIHGIFEQKPAKHLFGQKCPECSGVKPHTTLSWIINANAIHNNEYDYSLVEYINAYTKIKIICQKHGIFEQTPNSHLSDIGCAYCGGSFPLTTKDFIYKANKIHNNIYNYDEAVYKNMNTKIIIICSKHGKFEQRPMNHLNLKHGCPNCGFNISEKETKWLDSLNIPKDIRNPTIKVGNKIIKPDALDLETNTVYEFYGDYWHGNPTKYNANDINIISDKTFGYLYCRTIDRETLLINAGYKLITIWEMEWDEPNTNI